jgi:hypothetical protein
MAFFDLDGDFTIDEFRRSVFRVKNIPLYGPIIHKAFNGPIPAYNYSEEDLAVLMAGSAFVSRTSGMALHTWRAWRVARVTNPWVLTFYVLLVAAEAENNMTPEQKRGFNLHRYRSR